MFPGVNRRVLFTFLSALCITLGSVLAIYYARGGFRITSAGIMRGAGLLNANSYPTGAQVLINGRLVTATDDNIYLDPGEYDVEIIKDGYSPWRKHLKLQSELVTQTNALLFPVAPSLAPLTFTGVQNALPSPDGQRIVFYTASASAAAKNGLYLLDLTSNPLSLQRGARQIAEDTSDIDLATATMIWSPDSSELLLTSTKQGFERTVLVDISTKNTLSTLPDISHRSRQLLSSWEEEMYQREREYLAKFPPEVIAIATTAAKNVYFSPDKKKLLYTATASAQLPTDLISPVPAASTQREERTIEAKGIYVYDREEDRNFRIGTEKIAMPALGKHLLATDLFSSQARTLESSPAAFQQLQATTSGLIGSNFRTYHTSLYANTLQWLADSRHLLYLTSSAVKLVSYDGTNDTTVYSGPFAQNFVYPWSDGSKLVIITNFSPETPPNFYAVEIR